MGVVYRARDPRINREVALKAIPLADEFEADGARGGAHASFFREAEMAGRLCAPAHRHDLRRRRGRRHRLHRDGAAARPAPRRVHGRGTAAAAAIALEIVARLADALHYAHQSQVVHRDIKPANIMFDAPSGELKITDFGIARLTDSGRTRTGIVLGTPSFMSPEQLQGRAVTGRSDLFSLAVTPVPAADRPVAVPRRLDARR